jgi:hypothetical protein
MKMRINIKIILENIMDNLMQTINNRFDKTQISFHSL